MSDLDSFLGSINQQSSVDLEPIIQSAAKQYGIDPDLLRAHIQQESAGRPFVTSSQGAQGVAQIMPGTAQGLGVDNPYDPTQAIPAAANLISQNLKASNGDVPTAIGMYFGGPDKSKWGPKTAAYIKAVEGRYKPAGGDLEGFLSGAPSASAPASQAFLSDVGHGPPDQPAPPSGPASAAFLRDVSAPTAQEPGSGAFVVGEGSPHEGEPVSAAQEATVKALPGVDQNAPAGSKYLPYVMTKGSKPPAGHGDYYIDNDDAGTLRQVPMTQAEQAALADAEKQYQGPHGAQAVTNGLLQGFGPEAAGAISAVGHGISNALTGGKPAYGPAEAQWAANRVMAERLSEYRQAHPVSNALMTTAGSLTSGAALAGAGGAALDAAGVPGLLGPTGDFLAGRAGDGNALTRAASIMGNNALQGGGFGALSSHLDPNSSVGSQVGAGALAGAVLGAAGTGAKYGATKLGDAFPIVPDTIRSFTDPLSKTGHEAIANRLIASQAAGAPTDLVDSLIPGVKPTLATATGNRGLMAVEKAVRDIAPNAFQLRDANNDAARAAFADSFRGNNDTLAQAEAARDAETQPLLHAALGSASPADAGPVLSKIDEIMGSRAGQRSDVANALNRVSGKLFNDDAGMSASARKEYEGSLMRAIGSDDAAPTPASLTKAKARIGSVFDQVASGTNVKADDELMSRLGEIGADASRYNTDSEAKPILAHIEDIGNAVDQNRVIPGEAYQALTKNGAPLERNMGNSNSNISVPAQQIRDALDDALERSADPADLEALKTARNQYRNLKIIQDATNKTNPGEMIDPGKLLASVRKVTPNFAFRGGGDLGDAAQLGLSSQENPASLKTNPAQLLGVREDLDSIVRPLESKYGSAHPSVSPLIAVRDQLDRTLDQAMPGYGDYLARHEELTKPIEAQRFLLDRQITNPNGVPLPGATNRLLEAISAAHRAPGATQGKAVPEATVSAIQALRDDLLRSNITPDRNIRSDTISKLGTNQLLQKSGIPAAVMSLHVPGAGFLHGAASALYERQSPKIAEVLAQKMLHPEYGSAAFAPSSASSASAPVNPLMPGLAASYVNRLSHGKGDRSRPLPLPAP